MVVGDLGDLLPEPAFSRSHDHAPHADAIRICDRRSLVETRAQLGDIEVCVERKLLLDDERRHEDDTGAAVGSEPAREIEGMLCLDKAEERDDDVPVAHRGGAAGDPAQPAAGREPDPHRSRWYGTLVRMTFGSNSSMRLM